MSKKLSTTIKSKKKLGVKIDSTLNKNKIIVAPNTIIAKDNNSTIISEKLNTPIISQSGYNGQSYNDKYFIGGFRVVQSIQERDDIECCFRKIGMRVVVVIGDNIFENYILEGDDPCSNEKWVIDRTYDSNVLLKDDYSNLGPDIETQQDLNQIFNDLITDIIENDKDGDKHYIHDQFNPSSIWIIKHDLNKKPSITITDTAGSIVEGSVTYINNNEVRLYFNFPFSGYAYLN